MNKHITKNAVRIREIGFLIRKMFQEYVVWYKEQSRKKQALIAVVAFLVLGIFVRAIISRSDASDTQVVTRAVKVAPVSLLASTDKAFSLIGTVTSVSEATIRSESGGRLIRVNKKLGDQVYAGDVIASFENSGERASLLQAEGAYEQAKAARDIAKINSGQAGSSLSDTKLQAVNAVSSAYATLDDAIHGKTDIAFSSPQFDEAKLLLSVPDASLIIALEAKRKQIETMLRSREQKNKTITQVSDLASELSLMQNEAQFVKGYLDDLFTAYSKALPDNSFTQAALDQNKTSVQQARQNVTGAITSLVSSRTALTSSMTANEVAGNVTSVVSGTLATSEAQVKQALGAYNAAQSRLEKTIIRSPITGTLNSLTIETGDYITAFSQVAVVSNNGALEVVSSVTEDDAKRITVGSVVTINQDGKGVVTRIASAIDPTTRKIEVRIGITSGGTALVNGQSVNVAIAKSAKDFKERQSGPLTIPISALKLTPRGAFVFEVDASSTLVALPVREGAILGDQIQVLEGLTGDETIVVDARGLKEGVTVSISETH